MSKQEGRRNLISSGQLARYRRDGVLFPVPVLPPDEVRNFRSAFAALEAALGGRPSHIQMVQPHLFYKWAYDCATHPAILDAVESIIGPNILVHSASLFPKYPGEEGGIFWHQDGYYYGLNTPALVSAWVALSDSTPENGCLRVVPGSHRRGLVPHEQPAAVSAGGLSIRAAVEVDEREALDVPLRAGQMSLHHPYLIHGSQPNRSRATRLGYAIRYMAPHVRQTLRHHPVVLARGQDEQRHYKLLERTPGVSLQEGVPAQARLARWILNMRSESLREG